MSQRWFIAESVSCLLKDETGEILQTKSLITVAIAVAAVTGTGAEVAAASC